MAPKRFLLLALRGDRLFLVGGVPRGFGGGVKQGIIASDSNGGDAQEQGYVVAPSAEHRLHCAFTHRFLLRCLRFPGLRTALPPFPGRRPAGFGGVMHHLSPSMSPAVAFYTVFCQKTHAGRFKFFL